MLKLTEKEYKEKLKKKNIDVIPLEEYNGTHFKIKHKCTCGNIWNAKPSNVLNGKTCGHKKLNSHNDYIKNLNKKKIKIIPLEDYKGADVKILHKCTCGNEWYIKPNSVLFGNKCGCGYKKREHFNNRQPESYKDRKTLLYYIKVNNLYKIGIAIHEKYSNIKDTIEKQRYSIDINKGVDIEIIDTKIYDDGYKAYIMEQYILSKYSKFKYLGEKILTSGNTELFKIDIRNINE